MSLQRARVVFGDDPLSSLAAPKPSDYSEEAQPLEESDDVPAGNSPTIGDYQAFNAKNDNVRKSTTDNAATSAAVSSSLSTVRHSPLIAPPPEDEDLFLPKPAEPQPSEDIFSFPTAAAATTTTTKISPNNVIRGDGDDDLISDLKVAKLLEREENQDFELFGKAALPAPRVAKKKMDLDQEDDFLRQLDEITSSSSKRKDNSTASSSNKPSSTLSFAATTTQTQNLDLDALNLNDYISQNSSSGGGLFD